MGSDEHLNPPLATQVEQGSKTAKTAVTVKPRPAAPPAVASKPQPQPRPKPDAIKPPDELPPPIFDLGNEQEEFVDVPPPPRMSVIDDSEA